ncbi:MAG: LUD domain-containing protein [Bacillota bacterium]
MQSYAIKLKSRIDKGMGDQAAVRFRALLKMGLKARTSIYINRWPDLSDQVREIKERSVNDLERLTRQAVSRMEANGFRVFRAGTNAAALDYIKGIVSGGLVVKSKSNATKEIGLTGELEKKGCRVVETDLGDRICQLGDIPPSHPVGPAVHVPVEKVAEIFSKELGETLSSNPSDIVRAVRQSMRKDLLSIDFGISGANAITADTGSIVLTENEGNIRALTSLAPVHIVVAGVEKVVPALEDALKIVHAAAVYVVGQDIGTYITVLTEPPLIDKEGDVPGSIGPAEVHVVLLEQGRWEALRGGYGETLRCINCGSCMVECPIYLEMGENFGSRYIGGIGVLHTAFREGREKALESGLDLCINCMTCVEKCPLKIKTPGYILKLRRDMGMARHPLAKRVLLRRFAAKPMGEGISFLVKSGESLMGVKDPGLDGWRLKSPLMDLDCRRLFPSLTEKTFLSRYGGVSLPGGKAARVAFFAGCLINLFYTGIGESALSLLRRLGVEVVVPEGQMCCSIPSLTAGDWKGALVMMTSNIQLFEREKVDAIVTACGTCGSTLLEYPELLRDCGDWHRRAVAFSCRVRDIAAFISDLGVRDLAWGQYSGDVTYHDPCHLNRGMGVSEAPRKLLTGLEGLNLREMNDSTACCGFGGSFSFDFYKLSLGIGAKKVEAIAGTGAGAVVTGCPGCVMHLRDLLQREGHSIDVLHTVQVLDKAFAGRGGR